MLRALATLLLALTVPISAGPTLAAPPSVLVLHSYHPGLSWTDALNAGIHETFRAERPEALLWVEYLDTKRNTDASYLALQAALLRHKLAGNVFNLILATDNDALNFVLDHREDIFGHAPVVFCGVNDFRPGQPCVLAGENPDAIPVDLVTPSRFIFDHDQLERFGIDPVLLPEDSLILNQPARFYQIDKRYIWTATAAMAALLAALAMLMVSIRDRQETQAVLRRHKEQLEEAVRARTDHLRAANDELEREVNERVRAEGDLRKARARLEIEVDRRTRDLRFEIEQRRQAEAHIRDREAKARALINAPTEALLLMDQEGIILDINETGASRLGTNRESLIGQSLYVLVPPDQALRLRQAVDLVFTDGHVHSLTEYEQERNLDLRLYPVFDDGGMVTRVAVFMADVSGARRMARQIMLLDKINSLGRMAAGIAHEIRNPLTGIHAYLFVMDEICAELPGSEPVRVLRETIAKIRGAAGKMESVIRRVLDFSKPGTPRLEPLDLAGPVQEALGLMAPTLRKEGIEVETRLDPVPPILGDRMQLEQAVINIVDNASRAMRQTNGDKRIQIGLFGDADRVCLTVADSGPGIAPADRERIFDPFFTTAADGTGIGLSIVQRIVADHHGSISVDQGPAGGASFRLEFPLANGETA